MKSDGGYKHALTKVNDLKHCFEQWKILMEKCRGSGGEYIGGDLVKVVK